MWRRYFKLDGATQLTASPVSETSIQTSLSITSITSAGWRNENKPDRMGKQGAGNCPCPGFTILGEGGTEVKRKPGQTREAAVGSEPNKEKEGHQRVDQS